MREVTTTTSKAKPVMDTSQAALPLIPVLEQDWPILWKFADRLRELGYTERGISQAMGLADHSTRNLALWPVHLRRCRQQSVSNPCALLATFFLFEESIARNQLEQLLGDDVVDVMDRLFLVDQVDDGPLIFRFYLYPLLGRLILTDGHISNRNHLDQVYPLGSDSHFLTRLAPRPQVGVSLDLCTGSGVHAILAASHCQRSFGLDISPRALDFARFNAGLNRLEQVEFLQSDCYQNVSGQALGLDDPCSFDLITANPPFVPAPELVSLCRTGGVTGEDVTERIVRGLPSMLKPDGIFSMITNVPHFRDQTFFQRCENWLGSGQGWGMVMLSNHFWSLGNYVAGHLGSGYSGDLPKELNRWLDSYESVGMTTISNSQIYLFRSDVPWRIERDYGWPSSPVSGFIEGWIASLRALEARGPAIYRLHSGLRNIVWADGGEKAYLEWSGDHRWWQPQSFWMEGPAAQALREFQDHPQGLPSHQVDHDVLMRLLSDHLVTIVNGAAP